MLIKGRCVVLRKSGISLEEIKKNILELKGKNVKMEVNKGRKRIFYYEGVIENVYPSLFTVKFNESDDIYNIEKNSFSYFDVLCGDVKITNIIGG